MAKQNSAEARRGVSMRLPVKMHDQIAAAAEKHGLSVTQEVDLRLRASFGDEWARRVLALDEMDPTPPRLVRSA